MYCSNCGNKLKENARFCTACGTSSEGVVPKKTNKEKQRVLDELYKKENISKTIWIGVGIFQAIFGIMWDQYFLIMVGAWNVFAGFSRTINIYDNIHLVEEYDESLGTIIVFLIINLVIGGVIGVVGSIYDLTIRDYVLKNREVLE